VTCVSHRKGHRDSGVARSPQGDYGMGFGLLQWIPATAPHGALIYGSGPDFGAGSLGK